MLTILMDFKTQLPIHFEKADLAGVVFFARIFDLAHNAFELFLQHLEISWAEWFQNEKILFPIRKTKAQFFKPLYAGQVIDVTVTLSHLGRSSFTIEYVFFQNKQKTNCLTMTHVSVNKETLKPISFPEQYKTKFSSYLVAVAK